MNGELIEILRRHSVKYPLMAPTDAVKLIYQNEFGGGHLISDENACLKRLCEEYDGVEANERGSEYIGNGVTRLYLDGAKLIGLTPDSICRMFVYTANSHKGTNDGFIRKLESLKDLAVAGELPFSRDELDSYLFEYSKSGMPPVSHSESYRENYRPSYRIIDRRFVRLIPVVTAVSKELERKNSVVIAIDGRCASGKTTAAALLSELWQTDGENAPVVHMDDFFLPPELRTEKRYDEAGGNVHYERFADEVLPDLIRRESCSYRRFDCSEMDYGETVHIPKARVTIVEGSYSLNPAFGEYADVTVFCDVEPELQMERIRLRDGDYAETFKRKWIPLEEKYFDVCGILGRCEIWLN